MTARESALYTLGVKLGTAHGLQQAAKNLGELARQVREWPAAKQNVQWLNSLSDASVFQGDAKLAATALVIREFASKLGLAQGELADWLVAAQTEFDRVTAERKAEYVSLLAGIEPDTVAPMGAPRRARARGKTIGQRVMGRIAEGLKELADADSEDT